jgi:electron transport complex protein RnfE
MGIGFTIALFLMGSIREILGAGQWMGMNIPVIHDNPMLLFIMPAGGFFTLGVIIAVVNKIANRKPPLEIECGSCDNCPMSGKCDKKEVAGE